MQKKAKFIFRFWVVMVVLFFSLKTVQRLRDPMVDGMALSDWLPHLTYEVMSPDTRTNRVWAEAVVRKAGSKAIPLLLEHLSIDEDSRSYQLKEKLAKLVHLEISHPLYQRWDAATAFRILGTNGQTAVPQLKLMLENTNQMVCAAMCLGWVRAPGSLMMFTNLMNGIDEKKREAGLYGLGALEEIARPVTPQIIAMMQNETNHYIRIAAIETLGQIGPADQVIPLLTQIAKTDTNSRVRFFAARTMGVFHLEPEKARAALKMAEQDKDQRVRDGAALGLSILEEEIATEELRIIWREYYP